MNAIMMIVGKESLVKSNLHGRPSFLVAYHGKSNMKNNINAVVDSRKSADSQEIKTPPTESGKDIPEKKFLENLEKSIANYDRDMRSRRIRSGIAAKRTKG